MRIRGLPRPEPIGTGLFDTASPPGPRGALARAFAIGGVGA